MRKTLNTLLLAVIMTFTASIKLTAQVPTTSTDANEVWYYINCSPRNSDIPGAQWLTGAPEAGQILVSKFTESDAQRWKVVAHGDGFALVNKEHGTYMNTDQTWNGAVATSYLYGSAVLPSTPVKLVPTNLTHTGKPGVNIINQTATVSATNVIEMTTVTFQFYSAGSSVFMPISYGTNAINIHAGVFFVQDKEFLEGKIDEITTALNSSAEGVNPGQFSSEAIDGLREALLASQEILDDPATLDSEYIAAAEELSMIYEDFKTQVNYPEISSQVETWYFIQGTRTPNTYLTAGEAGAGVSVKNLNIIPNDTQLWKFVDNTNGTADGFAVQNKATGEFINTDTERVMATVGNMPENNLRFILHTTAINNIKLFRIENTEGSLPVLRFHCNDPAPDLVNWTGNKDITSDWLILSENESYRVQLSLALTTARNLYNAAFEGTEFGQYSAEVRAEFDSKLSEVEAMDVYAMSKEDLSAATLSIQEATAAFSCNDDVTTLSSIYKKKWFRLVNNMQKGTGYAGNKAMTSNGRLVDQKFTFETIDEESDAQLFSFELNADKTAAVAIVNKSTQMYLGEDGSIRAEMPVGLVFEITKLDANSFWINPVGNDPIHAAQSNSDILNWNSGAGSASAWRFEYVSEEEITEFEIPFIKAVAAAREKYNTALAFKGTEIGQYTAASMDAYNAIIVAEEAKNPATMTNEELIAGIETLGAASSGLVIITDIKLLGAKNAAVSYKWFRIINDQNVSEGSRNGKAMSSNGRLEEEPLTWEDKDVMSNAQLFRFELNAEQTKVLNIYNKAAELYVDAYGHLATESTEGNEFEITQLANGRSFWIHPTHEVLDTIADPNVMVRLAPLHAQAVGSHIVNWDDGAGSASAWTFEYVTTEWTNSVNEINESKYQIVNQNGLITVKGVETFEIYTLTGVKINSNTRLNQGVYLLKINNEIQKFIVN